MANYLSLEEAAQKLGIKADRLVELRSRGEVRGFRDGASWKFPETEIDRLADELGDSLSGGSGVLVSDQEVGSSISGLGSHIIGGDDVAGSDVNLVPSEGEGSDVAIVTSEGNEGKADGGSDLLLEIDSADLSLEDPAILHDSGQLDLDLEPNAGSTGPITDEELKELSDSNPDAARRGASPGSESGLSFGDEDDEDSGDLVIGAESGDVLGGDVRGRSGGASSLELLSDLDAGDSGLASKSSVGGDVLSELDLLSAEAGGSGLISGDSEGLLGSGSLGLSGSGGLSGIDDALDDDDDLMIADDDDDLVISNTGGDISIAGDSGINLMSPSDSGLSLESEPLDLAGSGISALDLGAELSEGGSGSGHGSRSGGRAPGSGVDFEADEEFQLSPSGIGLESDLESGSQVIEVEDSEAIGEAVEFGDADLAEVDPFGGDVFGDQAVAVDDEAMVVDDEGFGIEHDAATPVARTGTVGYEVPFTMLQVVGLVFIICTLSLGGMLMTDLIRNMWTYQEPAAPVSSLTDTLISMMGFDA